MTAPAERVRILLDTGALDLPLPGGGATPQRHRALLDAGRDDLSTGRLVEAHTDAVAILAEAGRSPRPGYLYGVWAAGRSTDPLLVDGTTTHPVLRGTRAFSTGVGICDAALVTADRAGDDRPVLVDLDLRRARREGRMTTSTTEWATPAFAETATGTITIASLDLDEATDLVGEPGWYLDRPGFWHGAIGPAAVWAGGAIALVDHALTHLPDHPHARAHAGALRATAWNLTVILDAAGREIDADPDDKASAGRARALSVRHLVERAATDTLDRFGRALGPAPLAFDPDIARRATELTLYLRQNHAERDLEALHLHAPPMP